MTAPLALLELEPGAPGETVALLSGEVDLSNAAELEAQLVDALRRAERLTLDLTGVEYMDSQGARLLQRLADEHVSGPSSVTLVVATDSFAADLIAMIRLGDLVPVVEPPA